MPRFSPLAGVLRALFGGEALRSIARPLAQKAGYAARSYRRSFYVGMCALFAAVIAVDAVVEMLARDRQSLDFVVRHRLSSPKPDPSVLIVDIDEKSLAALSERYGRWPWPRSVLAEAISTISDKGAKAIALNVMLSDPDMDHPNDDRVFEEVAVSTKNVVYPLVRLNPKNDSISTVRASMIPGVRLSEAKGAGDRTVAVLIPMFPGTHDKLGAVNLPPDDDGIVRRHFPWLNEVGFAIPSMALRVLEFSGLKAKIGAREEERGFLLNWRNKRGDYRRISFADAFAAMNGRGDLDLSNFRDAIVVIGASAPGIAAVKGTSASAMTDENTILATSIDDLKNGTFLRRPPAWASAAVSLVFVLLLARAFYLGTSEQSINRLFGIGQTLLLAVTIASASYTTYIVDLSDSFVFALCFFAVAKVHALVDRNTSRGVRAFAQVGADLARTKMIVMGFAGGSRGDRFAGLRAQVEALFGVKHAFLLDNVFGESNLFADVCHGWNYLVAFCRPEDIRSSSTDGVEIRKAGTWVDLMGLIKGVAGDLSVFRLGDVTVETLSDAAALRRAVGERIIEVGAELVRLPAME